MYCMFVTIRAFGRHGVHARIKYFFKTHPQKKCVPELEVQGTIADDERPI